MQSKETDVNAKSPIRDIKKFPAREANTFPAREGKRKYFPEGKRKYFPEGKQKYFPYIREAKIFPIREEKTFLAREGKLDPKCVQNTKEDVISIGELIQLRGEESLKCLNVSGILSQLNLKLHPIKGDGNCLYRCLSQHLYGTEIMHERCRAEIAAFVADEANYTNLFEIYTLAQGASINDLCGHILTPKSHGGEIDIIAASWLYNVKIIVLSAFQKPLGPYGPNNAVHEWCLVYRPEISHYDCTFAACSSTSSGRLVIKMLILPYLVTVLQVIAVLIINYLRLVY